MAEFPAIPLWTDAYLGDTHHLTTIEHGAYLLLLMTAWRSRDCRLPNDDKLLARYARLTPGQWKRIAPTIREFFDVDGDHLVQGRLTDEYKAVRQLSKRQSRKARTRWLKNNNNGDATASTGHQSGNASPSPYPNTLDTNVSKGAAAPSLDVLVYRRGKEILGRSAGGQITKAIKKENGRYGAVLDAIELAATKADPLEYFAGYLKNGSMKSMEEIYDEVRQREGWEE